MSESEELDLTNSNWKLENEIYLVSIVESLKDNFPTAEIEKELGNFNFTTEDLLDQSKLGKFLNHLNEKFPEE